MKKEKVLMGWAGGISSAVALYEIKSPEYKLNGLFASISQKSDTVLGRQIPKALLELQALSLEEKLTLIGVPEGSDPFQSSEEIKAMQTLGTGPVKRIALGTVKAGKNHSDALAMCQPSEMRAVFPLWNWQSKEVARVFLMLGFQAIVMGIDSKKIPANFLGRNYDQSFVKALPAGVDPIGAGGEFQTFVFNGPFFQVPISFKKGEKTQTGDWTYIPLLQN